MKRLLMYSLVSLAMTLLAVFFFSTASNAAPAGVEVSLERYDASVGVGDRITVRARVVNTGTEPTDRLVAHLNVATLDPEVYVDLEDWTSGPTLSLDPVPPGGSATATWEIQAVNVGRFNVYVVVLPVGSSAGPLVASPPQLVQVAGRRTLSPGGALPVTVIMPVLLGLAALGVRLRLRRSR
jgi:hypothetical protein